MRRRRRASAGIGSEFREGGGVREVVLDGAEVLGDVVLPEHVFRVEAVEAQGLRKGKVGQLPLPVKRDEQRLLRLGVEVPQSAPELVLKVGWKLKADGHDSPFKSILV